MSTQTLRDAHGKLIGMIEISGNNKQTLRDQNGRMLGTFDGQYTRDSHGKLVGHGNLLTTLLK